MKERTELNELKEMGYFWENPYEIVEYFEGMIANFAGSQYAIAVDSATHAIELCLRFLNTKGEINVPCKTYPSIPMTILKIGAKIKFTEDKWHGVYQLDPYPVIDGSLRFKKSMFIKQTLHCLSFQQKKHLPIGRGGMILTDDKKAYSYLKRACHDGRMPGQIWHKDNIAIMGYHYYMTPDDAARGILLFNDYKERSDLGGSDNYPDLRNMDFFKNIEMNYNS